MIEVLGSEDWKGPRYANWTWHWNALILVLEEIEGLIHANAPLGDGLFALSEDAPHRKLRELFLALHRDVTSGFPLHEAMRRLPAFFPAYCADAVHAGEESGRLAEVLHELQVDVGRRFELRRRTQDVGAYLFGVILMEALIILGLLQFVAPQAVAVTMSHAHNPPFLMRLLNRANDLQIPHLFVLAAVVIPMIWMLTQNSALNGSMLSRGLRRLGLVLPVSRKIIAARALAQGGSIAALLAEAGAPLHAAIHSAAKSELAPEFQRAFLRLAERLEQGNSLGETLRDRAHGFPKAFCGLLALGEQSGQVPEALRQISELYREQGLRNARMALDIGGPLILCATAGMVFVVYLAFFQWIFQLPTLIPTA